MLILRAPFRDSVGHDGEFFLYMNDRQVTSTTMTHSELLLADGGCKFRTLRGRIHVHGGIDLGIPLARQRTRLAVEMHLRTGSRAAPRGCRR